MRPLRTLTAGAALVAGTLTWAASPAAALDCPHHPDPSPAAVATGTEQMADDEGFFDLFDAGVVVIGTGAEPDDDGTEVDVVAALGTGSIPPAIVLEPVPGEDPWSGPITIAEGELRFLPVIASDDEGAYRVPLCAPGSPMDSTTVEELEALATSSGVAFVEPDATVAPVPGGSGSGGSGSGSGIGVVPLALGAAGLAAVGALAVVIARNRVPAGAR